MNFSLLEGFHTKWRDILVIGKTIEREDKKYHIIGMTLADDAKLYIIEPYIAPEPENRKGIRNYRRMLKEHDRDECCYLHCSDFYLGSQRLQPQGGQGGPLQYSSEDYAVIQLFFDMMNAGWTVPEWLQSVDWEHLQLVTLTIANMDKLPEYSPEMPITITHRPHPVRHLVEQTVTLHVGKSRSFYFMDADGDKVQCHINQVTLIDVWKNTEEELNDPKLAERFTPEQLEQAKKHSYDALEQNCPKGMCYVGIEYECSKNLDLVFYSKEYLKSRPGTRHGSASFLMMRLNPDKKTGTHGLPLKGCVIDTPLSPDATEVPAELFLYFEKANAWDEIVN